MCSSTPPMLGKKKSDTIAIRNPLLVIPWSSILSYMCAVRGNSCERWWSHEVIVKVFEEETWKLGRRRRGGRRKLLLVHERREGGGLCRGLCGGWWHEVHSCVLVHARSCGLCEILIALSRHTFHNTIHQNMDTLKGLISSEEKEPSMWDEINNQCALTIQQVSWREKADALLNGNKRRRV